MSHRLRLALLFALAAAMSGLTILRGISPHDEGLMLQGASRIVSGQWPYRDFWTNYPPGQFIVLAVLQDVFGASLLAWRVLRTLIDAGVALVAYELVRTIVRSVGAKPRVAEAYAGLAWLAAAGAMAFPTGPGPNPPALLLALSGVLAASGGLAAASRQASPGVSARTLAVRPVLDRPDRQSSPEGGRAPATREGGAIPAGSPPARNALLAGALAGLAFCFRFELGLAAVVGVLIALPRAGRPRALLAAVLTALVPLVPLFLTAPGAMLHDTFGFYGIQSLQRLPFPLGFEGPLKPSKLIEFYIPLVLVLGCALWGATMAIGRRSKAEIALLPLALVSLAYLLGRPDEFHLVPLAVLVAVALAAAATSTTSRAVRAALAIPLALIAVHGLDRKAGQLLHPPPAAAVPGPAGDGVQTTPKDAQALNELERAVAAHIRPGEPIFIANPRHDLVHAGDPLLYVILGHPDPTRYDVMQPGLVTIAAVQREIIASLQRTHTRVVIRWLDPRASQAEPDGAGRSSGVHLLDSYLRANFRPRARFGVYELLVRPR